MKWYAGCVMVLLAVMLTGCGDKEINENKPLDMIAAEAARMDQAELQAMMDRYQTLISQKTELLKGYEAEIKDLSISDLMGENAKTIKEQTKNLSTSLDKLQKQMEVYAKQLVSAVE